MKIISFVLSNIISLRKYYVLILWKITLILIYLKLKSKPLKTTQKVNLKIKIDY